MKSIHFILIILNFCSLIRVSSCASFTLWLYEVLSTVCVHGGHYCWNWMMSILWDVAFQDTLFRFVSNSPVNILHHSRTQTCSIFYVSLSRSLTLCLPASGLLANNDFGESLPLDLGVLWTKPLLSSLKAFLFCIRRPLFLSVVVVQEVFLSCEIILNQQLTTCIRNHNRPLSSLHREELKKICVPLCVFYSFLFYYVWHF